MGSKLVLVVAALMFLFAYAHASDRYTPPADSILNINDNSITIAYYSDTIVADDPITTERKLIIYSEDHGPVKLNGEKIYSPFNNTDLQHYTKLRKGKKYLVEHLLRKTNRYYKRLVKAGYNADIRNMLVNAKGKIIYYEYSGIVKTDISNPATLKPELISRVNKKVKRVLNKVQLMPATVDHSTVAYRINHYKLL